MSCRLEDEKFCLAPQDKGEPPNWVPASLYDQVEWVDRELFDKIKAKRHEKPCELCTDAIKKQCEFHLRSKNKKLIMKKKEKKFKKGQMNYLSQLKMNC